jgi:isoleucyl-tRNA synthetase
MRYANEWKRVVRRMARWIDMENDYKTLDLNYMESVWWVCKQLFDKDLIVSIPTPIYFFKCIAWKRFAWIFWHVHGSMRVCVHVSCQVM